MADKVTPSDTDPKNAQTLDTRLRTIGDTGKLTAPVPEQDGKHRKS